MGKQKTVLLDDETVDILEQCQLNPYFNFSAFVREALKNVTLPFTLAKE